MNRTEFIAMHAEKHGMMKKDAAVEVERFLETFVGAIEADKEINFMGVLKVEQAKKDERQGRNPQNGEAITIAAHMATKVVLSKKLRKREI